MAGQLCLPRSLINILTSLSCDLTSHLQGSLAGVGRSDGDWNCWPQRRARLSPIMSTRAPDQSSTPGHPRQTQTWCSTWTTTRSPRWGRGKGGARVVRSLKGRSSRGLSRGSGVRWAGWSLSSGSSSAGRRLRRRRGGPSPPRLTWRGAPWTRAAGRTLTRRCTQLGPAVWTWVVRSESLTACLRYLAWTITTAGTISDVTAACQWALTCCPVTVTARWSPATWPPGDRTNSRTPTWRASWARSLRSWRAATRTRGSSTAGRNLRRTQRPLSQRSAAPANTRASPPARDSRCSPSGGRSLSPWRTFTTRTLWAESPPSVRAQRRVVMTPTLGRARRQSLPRAPTRVTRATAARTVAASPQTTATSTATRTPTRSPTTRCPGPPAGPSRHRSLRGRANSRARRRPGHTASPPPPPSGRRGRDPRPPPLSPPWARRISRYDTPPLTQTWISLSHN